MLKPRVILPLLLLVFLSNAVVHAQTLLRGQVLDSDGEQLIGVSIKVLKNGQFLRGAITDFEGNYRIPVDPGVYTLEFNYAGFSTLLVRDVVLEPGKIQFLTTTLQADATPIPYCPYYNPPLIDMSPGNTGLTLLKYQLRRTQ
ncbi:MAG: carboxypeptidase regulatory-like domain-containing protein [Saprospiraceae bacterium]|nr:carboxypeptidase regulatory-like domain-containing protein [Saprospiraceae bacterium]